MMMMIFCAEKKRDPFEVLVLRAYICIYKYIYYIYIWWLWCYNRLSSNKSLFHSKTHLPKA